MGSLEAVEKGKHELFWRQLSAPSHLGPSLSMGSVVSKPSSFRSWARVGCGIELKEKKNGRVDSCKTFVSL